MMSIDPQQRYRGIEVGVYLEGFMVWVLQSRLRAIREHFRAAIDVCDDLQIGDERVVGQTEDTGG
jgi:hypothetical protein